MDNFAFDHKPEHWIGIDVDGIYHTYFEDSILLAKSKLFDGIGHPDAIKLFVTGLLFPLPVIMRG